MNEINCPVCGNNDFKEIIYLKDFPISNLGLSNSKEEALIYNTYDMNIVCCNKCSHIYNNIPIQLEYKQKSNTTYFTNEKQKQYIKELANDLIKKYNLRDKNILEIGCGDGLFLKEISKNNKCIGYEPSYEKLYKNDNVTIINDYFVADENNLKNIDWIVIRHVLEHFENPFDFIGEGIMQKLLKLNPTCKFFIEVPNVKPTIDEARINDFIHEHISHFSIYSLEYLLNRLNLEIVEIYTTQNEENIVAICEIDKEYLFNYTNITQISNIFKNSIKNLQNSYQKILKENKTIAIWGAEGRGASLINIIQPYLKGDEIIVDSDNRKFGKFIPSIALQIYNFMVLKEKNIDALIITTLLGKDNILKEIKENNIKIKNIYVLSKNGLSKVENG